MNNNLIKTGRYVCVNGHILASYQDEDGRLSLFSHFKSDEERLKMMEVSCAIRAGKIMNCKKCGEVIEDIES